MKKSSDQVRIGIIGVSGRGWLSKHWHQPNGKSIVVAGADLHDKFLAEFRKEYGESAFTARDYRRLLERKDIDAIAVTTPDHCHEEHAIAALEAGKHVFCEKPLAITTEGCDRILKSWKSSGKHLMVGFCMRYMNIFRTMKEIVEAGTIGEIRAVWVRHFVGMGGRWYFHDWHASRKTATSLLLQKASHDIDMIHWITGQYTRKVAAFGSLDFYGGNKPNSRECFTCPERDTCTEAQEWPHHSYCCFRKEVDVEDNSIVMMEMGTGIKAVYTQCHFSPDYFRNYTFIGTEGRIENLDDTSKVILKTRSLSRKWKNLADRTYDVKPAQGGHGGSDPLICADFVEMIRTGKKPVADPVAGRMSVAVGCAATKSLRSGGRVMAIKPLPPGIKAK